MAIANRADAMARGGVPRDQATEIQRKQPGQSIAPGARMGERSNVNRVPPGTHMSKCRGCGRPIMLEMETEARQQQWNCACGTKSTIKVPALTRELLQQRAPERLPKASTPTTIAPGGSEFTRFRSEGTGRP